MEYLECNYTLDKVKKTFKDIVFLKKEQRGGNGIWVLHFKQEEFYLEFCSDRGFLDVYIVKDKKMLDKLIDYPQIRNLRTNTENIDFIVDFLYQHRNEIFCND